MEINESFIRDNINLNELGLIFLEYEYNTDVGRIDILCEDDDGDLVPIEVKLGEAGDNAIGQILGYMKAINAERGVIIAQSFSDRVKLVAEDLNIDLVKYELKVEINNNIEDNIFNKNKKIFISEAKRAYSLDLIDWIWIGNVQKDRGTSIDPDNFIKNIDKYLKYLENDYYYINIHYKIQNNVEKMFLINSKELKFNKI